MIWLSRLFSWTSAASAEPPTTKTFTLMALPFGFSFEAVPENDTLSAVPEVFAIMVHP